MRAVRATADGVRVVDAPEPEGSGRRVDVVAESEGTLGVYAMLAQHPRVPLANVALLSPIIAPGQASYPVGDGSAEVPGSELQGVVWFVGGLSPFGTSGAQTLIGSVNQVGARFAAQAARHHRLRWMALVPLADADPAGLQPAPQRAGRAGAARGTAGRPGGDGYRPRVPDPPPGQRHPQPAHHGRVRGRGGERLAAPAGGCPVATLPALTASQGTSGGPWRTRLSASAGLPRHQPSASTHQVRPAGT